MNPAKATVEIIMTIFGPYLSAAHPLIYHLVSLCSASVVFDEGDLREDQ